MKLFTSAMLLLIALSGHAAPTAGPTIVVPDLSYSSDIYAGGVAGSSDLAVASNSAAFRKSGGGLYLHNTGWGHLTSDEKTKVLRVFHGRPVMIELGFGGGWGTALKSNYLARGIRPKFIAANAFANNNHPTAAGWASYTKSLRDAGAPKFTLIMPTFEYQNFGPNIATLLDNEVSKVQVFQDIITVAGGIVLDTPSGYFFGREENYRTWVVDAIQWTRAQGFQVVVIVSPHTSGLKWGADASRFLKYLQDNNAMPTAFAVENYIPNDDPTYLNSVGTETNPNNTLGVALTYTHTLHPKTPKD